MADNTIKLRIDIDGNAREVTATVVEGLDDVVKKSEKARLSISSFTESILALLWID